MPTPFTGQLGTQLSELGNIVPGLAGTFAPLPFGFQAHVLNASQVRVVYTTQVDDSALATGAYTVLAVSGPVPNFLPTVVEVEFYDSDQYSVVLTMNQSMTFSTVYSMSVIGVMAQNGNEVTSNSSNFVANVPDPPLPIGAFQTARGDLDLCFNYSVGPTSPAATATLEGFNEDGSSAGTSPLDRLPWNSSIPTNCIRFQITTVPTAYSYVVSYSNVFDSSYNSGAGAVPLTIASRAPLPYGFTTIMEAQIIDGWVDALSNAASGPDVAYLNIYFSCPMYGPDVVNATNWTVAVNNVLIPILSIENHSSVTGGTTFAAVDSRTYFAKLKVPATSSSTAYIIGASIRSEDLAYTTSPFDYTGTITLMPLNSPPRVLSALVDDNALSLRFDKGIGFPDSTTLSVKGISNPLIGSIDAVTNNGGLIQIQTTSTNGLATGTTVVIAGVEGTVEANGRWVITASVTNPRQFTLVGSTFVHTYTGGGIVSLLTGTANVTSIELSSTLQSLFLVVEDLMNSFYDHNNPPYGAGHVTPDTVNFFVPSDFPVTTLASTLTALNRYRDVYYSHSQSTIYHNFADPNPVLLPYAVDIPSAVTLASALISSFTKHNANVGVHFYAGIAVFSANLLDTLVLGFEGLQNGAQYMVSTSLQNVFIDVGEGSKTKKFAVSAGFVGQAVPPYVASALTQSGLQISPTGLSFEQDSVTVWFSKPLQEIPVGTAPGPSSGYITITGAPGLNVLGTSWVSNLVLSVGVSGMTASSYSLDVLGVEDQFGNSIAEAP